MSLEAIQILNPDSGATIDDTLNVGEGLKHYIHPVGKTLAYKPEVGAILLEKYGFLVRVDASKPEVNPQQPAKNVREAEKIKQGEETLETKVSENIVPEVDSTAVVEKDRWGCPFCDYVSTVKVAVANHSRGKHKKIAEPIKLTSGVSVVPETDASLNQESIEVSDGEPVIGAPNPSEESVSGENAPLRVGETRTDKDGMTMGLSVDDGRE